MRPGPPKKDGQGKWRVPPKKPVCQTSCCLWGQATAVCTDAKRTNLIFSSSTPVVKHTHHCQPSVVATRKILGDSGLQKRGLDLRGNEDSRMICTEFPRVCMPQVFESWHLCEIKKPAGTGFERLQRFAIFRTPSHLNASSGTPIDGQTAILAYYIRHVKKSVEPCRRGATCMILVVVAHIGEIAQGVL